MSAVLLSVVVVAAALAVDVGSVYFERREAQALTDLAAITAAAHLESAPEAALLTFTDNRMRKIVLVRDDHTPDPLETTDAEAALYVKTGRYVADPDTEPDLRFTVGGDPRNAVRVTLRKKAKLYFGSIIMKPPTISTAAVAASTEEAAISVGSRLVSIDSGVLNSLMGALLGTNLSLRAADYRALADTDVDTLSFFDSLAGELDLTAGTYNDVLDAEATIGQVLRALSASVPQGSGAQVAIQGLFNASGVEQLTVPLSHIVDLGSLGKLSVGQQNAGLDAAVGVMELIGATAAVANREKQLNLSPDLNVVGLVGVSLDIAVGEPPLNLPWFVIGEAGKIARTAQARVRLVASVRGAGSLGNIIELPIYFEVGYAEAKLRNVVCEAGRIKHVLVDGRPGIFEAWVGSINEAQLKNFDVKPVPSAAKLVNLPLAVPSIRITGSANVMSGNLFWQTKTFDRQEIEDRTEETVRTNQLAQPLVQSLLTGLTLETQIGAAGLNIGIGIATSVLENLLARLLAGVTQPLDNLVYGILSALGIRVGEADIWVNGAACGRAVLVR